MVKKSERGLMELYERFKDELLAHLCDGLYAEHFLLEDLDNIFYSLSNYYIEHYAKGSDVQTINSIKNILKNIKESIVEYVKMLDGKYNLYDEDYNSLNILFSGQSLSTLIYHLIDVPFGLIANYVDKYTQFIAGSETEEQII